MRASSLATRAAVQLIAAVGASAGGKHVVSAVTVDAVRAAAHGARAAPETIVAGVATNRVICPITVNRVVPRAAVDRVVFGSG